MARSGATFVKGQKKPGQGRPTGSVNKSTALAREAIALFVDQNAPRLQGWLDEIAADPAHGPKVAFDCVRDLLEYHVPKLNRSEVKHEGDMQLHITHESK